MSSSFTLFHLTGDTSWVPSDEFFVEEQSLVKASVHNGAVPVHICDGTLDKDGINFKSTKKAQKELNLLIAGDKDRSKDMAKYFDGLVVNNATIRTKLVDAAEASSYTIVPEPDYPLILYVLTNAVDYKAFSEASAQSDSACRVIGYEIDGEEFKSKSAEDSLDYVSQDVDLLKDRLVPTVVVNAKDPKVGELIPYSETDEILTWLGDRAKEWIDGNFDLPFVVSKYDDVFPDDGSIDIEALLESSKASGASTPKPKPKPGNVFWTPSPYVKGNLEFQGYKMGDKEHSENWILLSRKHYEDNRKDFNERVIMWNSSASFVSGTGGLQANEPHLLESLPAPSEHLASHSLSGRRGKLITLNEWITLTMAVDDPRKDPSHSGERFKPLRRPRVWPKEPLNPPAEVEKFDFVEGRGVHDPVIFKEVIPKMGRKIKWKTNEKSQSKALMVWESLLAMYNPMLSSGRCDDGISFLAPTESDVKAFVDEVSSKCRERDVCSVAGCILPTLSGPKCAHHSLKVRNRMRLKGMSNGQLDYEGVSRSNRTESRNPFAFLPRSYSNKAFIPADRNLRMMSRRIRIPMPLDSSKPVTFSFPENDPAVVITVLPIPGDQLRRWYCSVDKRSLHLT